MISAPSLPQGHGVWIENENGKIRQVADIYAGIEPGVINCEHQWWYPELNQSFISGRSMPS